MYEVELFRSSMIGFAHLSALPRSRLSVNATLACSGDDLIVPYWYNVIWSNQSWSTVRSPSKASGIFIFGRRSPAGEAGTPFSSRIARRPRSFRQLFLSASCSIRSCCRFVVVWSRRSNLAVIDPSWPWTISLTSSSISDLVYGWSRTSRTCRSCMPSPAGHASPVGFVINECVGNR